MKKTLRMDSNHEQGSELEEIEGSSESKSTVDIDSASQDTSLGSNPSYNLEEKTLAEYQEEYRQRLEEETTIAQKSIERRRRQAANSKAYRERKKMLKRVGIFTPKGSSKKSVLQLQSCREHPFETVILIPEGRTPDSDQLEKMTKMDKPVRRFEQHRDCGHAQGVSTTSNLVKHEFKEGWNLNNRFLLKKEQFEKSIEDINIASEDHWVPNHEDRLCATSNLVKHEFEEGWDSDSRFLLNREQCGTTIEDTNITGDHPFNSVKNEVANAEDGGEWIENSTFVVERNVEKSQFNFTDQSYPGIVKTEEKGDEIDFSSDNCQKIELQDIYFKNLECHFCNYVTEDRVILKKHIQSIHHQFACDLCDYSAPVEFSLDCHIETEHSVSQEYNCDDYSEKLKDPLETHLNEVHSQQENSCHLCSFTSTTEADLKYHMVCVHTQKEQKCHLCSYTTYYSSHLMVHVNTVHLEAECHKCNLCNFVSNEQYYLDNHMSEAHSQPKTYRCEMCSYSTLKKCQIKYHTEAVHLKIKNHSCHLCDFTTARSNILTRHVNDVHLQLRNHRCQLCDYTSNRKQQLVFHVASVHVKAKDEECSYCDYRTTWKHQLKAHVENVHMSVKRFKCDLCESGFNRKANLRKHLNTVHSKMRKSTHTESENR